MIHQWKLIIWKQTHKVKLFLLSKPTQIATMMVKPLERMTNKPKLTLIKKQTDRARQSRGHRKRTKKLNNLNNRAISQFKLTLIKRLINKVRWVLCRPMQWRTALVDMVIGLLRELISMKPVELAFQLNKSITLWPLFKILRRLTKPIGWALSLKKKRKACSEEWWQALLARMN